MSQKGHSGLGANRRTCEFTGGGAAKGTITVPVESVLTFKLDQPLRVTAR